MKLFEDLPSTESPITAENLNQIKDKLTVISSTEPIGDDREKVWIDEENKRIYIKNDNDEYEEFVNAIDNLTSEETTKPLSAKQGKQLDEKINNFTVFSTTEEKTTGKWINGKPIYRKVFNNINAPNTENADTELISSALDNCETVINYYGTFSKGTNVWLLNHYYSSTFSISSYYNKNNNSIRATAGNQLIGAIGHIIIEYTKTTD